jgi:hypothetical protein
MLSMQGGISSRPPCSCCFARETLLAARRPALSHVPRCDSERRRALKLLPVVLFDHLRHAGDERCSPTKHESLCHGGEPDALARGRR